MCKYTSITFPSRPTTTILLSPPHTHLQQFRAIAELSASAAGRRSTGRASWRSSTPAASAAHALGLNRGVRQWYARAGHGLAEEGCSNWWPARRVRQLGIGIADLDHRAATAALRLTGAAGLADLDAAASALNATLARARSQDGWAE